jgi:hypothetical protein
MTRRTLQDDLDQLAADSPQVAHAHRVSRARMAGATGCTCTWFEDVDIVHPDPGCPVHGLDARPENWETPCRP